ncbi:MAG TPA: hypothetical protein VNF73_01810 [Candidatus Saccharimonadales bacterium]|nr:hypothetical protein [Candidatus Saccharimonadales bacterium]
MIEHEDVREALEIAVVEPGGLDRLLAGDTSEAAIVAGHLAGCPSCMAEFTRLRRTSALIRDVLVTEPPTELRERTLAFVRALGRPRGTVEGLAATPAVAAGPGVAAGSVGAGSVAAGVLSGPAPLGRAVGADDLVPDRRPAAPALGPSRGWIDALRAALRPGSPAMTWLVATAAIAIVAATLTAGILVGGRPDSGRAGGSEVAALTQISDWTIRIAEQPDARRVVLAAASGTAAGTIDLSPGSREMVVVANGLTPPTDTQVYRCWVLVGGQRQSLGQMYFNSAGLAYWVGSVDVLAKVGPGSAFGVSLVDSSAPAAGNGAVLTGAF